MHDRFVERIKIAFTFRTGAKTDEREWQRRHQLPVGRLVDPRRKQTREATVLAYSRCQTFVSEVAHHHPQLERAEASTELDTIIGTATHFFLLGRAKIL